MLGGKSHFLHYKHRTEERDFPQVRITSEKKLPSNKFFGRKSEHVSKIFRLGADFLINLIFSHVQRYGTVRGEDVPFSLGLPYSQLFPYNYSQQDFRTSRMFIHYLTNFIQTGYVKNYFYFMTKI